MQMKKQEICGFSKMMLLQCLILFLGICGGIWINRYIFIPTAVFTILICFTKNINNIYYHLFFCMSFTVVYKLSPTTTSLFAYVMIVTGVILIVRINFFKVTQLIPILIFSAYLIVGMGDNYTTAFKMIMGIILFYFFVNRVKLSDFKNHIMAFILGVIGSSIVGTFRTSLSQLSAYFRNEYTLYDGRNVTYRFTGLNYDPNFYAMSVIFAVVLSMILIMNKIGNKILMWIIFVSLLFFGFQTYSKMFLFSVVIIGIVSMIYMLRSPKMMVIALAFVFILGTGIVTWLKKIGYMDIMFSRLFEGDISTGRFDLWRIYFEYLNNSPLSLIFGRGIGANYLSAGGPHNTYVESVYFVGILGSILYLFMIVLIFRAQKYNRRKRIINYLLLLAFIIMSGVLGCFTINELSFYYMLMWVGLNINISSKRDVFEEGNSSECLV